MIPGCPDPSDLDALYPRYLLASLPSIGLP